MSLSPKKGFIELNDQLLRENKFEYDTEQIENSLHFDAISLRVLVRTQKLTPYICAKYVVFGGTDEKYAFGTEDAWISTDEIPYYQPHITLEEIQNAHIFVKNEESTEENENLRMKQEDCGYFMQLGVEEEK
ncbi:MAG: hypothetical protein MUP82_09595 [Candidatus Marinimicrobia bacterium]|nr:hypothetical protein [Candidatus Neomarinimicrobiota bacterium]